jgi:hypothetical protein
MVAFLATFAAQLALGGSVLLDTYSNFSLHGFDGGPVDLQAVPGVGMHSGSLDRTFNSTATAHAVGFAMTGGGMAQVGLQVNTEDENGQAFYSSEVGAALFADVGIYQRQPLPPPFNFTPPVPMLITLKGDCSVSGGDGLNIGGSINLFSVVSLKGIETFGSAGTHATTNPGDQTFGEYDKTFPAVVFPSPTFEPILAYSFTASASVNSQGIGGGIFIQGGADPEMSFDQPAFDAYALQHGFPTFNLADYYGIELSEGMMVPEPSAIALVIVAMPICLPVVRTLRRRRLMGRG